MAQGKAVRNGRTEIGDPLNGRARQSAATGMISLPLYLQPRSWACCIRGLALGAACALALILINVFEVLTPPPVTISALVVFPVLVSAWLLPLRATVAIAASGMVMQAGLAYVNAIDWITAGADIGALALMATIGHFAGENWLAMKH